MAAAGIDSAATLRLPVEPSAVKNNTNAYTAKGVSHKGDTSVPKSRNMAPIITAKAGECALFLENRDIAA